LGVTTLQVDQSYKLAALTTDCPTEYVMMLRMTPHPLHLPVTPQVQKAQNTHTTLTVEEGALSKVVWQVCQ